MIGVRSPFDDQYDGSRMFVWLADLCGLSVDLINFLICQISALLLASLFRSLLHPSRASVASRHAFGLCLGLFFGYFCFGQQAIHIAGLPALCYIIMRTQSARFVQRYTMAVAMGYLSCVHLYRLLYDYGSTTIDITGPLMMITQKVTSLAFSLHDGQFRAAEKLSETQRFHAVRRCPSALEYFAFCLQFQSLMAGPIVLFRDYMDFVDGANWRQHAAGKGAVQMAEEPLMAGAVVREPSPTRTVVQKMLGSVLCAFVFMKFSKVYPVKNIKEADWVETTGLATKLWFLMCATLFFRFKYYHAWLMGDAICNNSGLGFNGYDATGRAKWDLCSNIDILGFEFATNFRDGINSWNLATNRWLRNVVYDRVPKRYGTVLTFGLSAVWHGFYPGYYMTFASGALIVLAARLGRRHLRPRFLEAVGGSQRLYDVVTVMLTRVFMAYATFPFIVLEFGASLNMYLSVFLCLHLVAAVAIVAIPQLLPASSSRSGSADRRRQPAASSIAQHNDANGTNGSVKSASLANTNTTHCDISASSNPNKSSNGGAAKLRRSAAAEAVVINHQSNPAAQHPANGDAVSAAAGSAHSQRQQGHFVASNGAFITANSQF